MADLSTQTVRSVESVSTDLRSPDQEPRPSAPDIDVVYYTDPLCSWSWALEPQWRKLRFEFGNRISWQYCQGGMIGDWRSFSDPLNSVSNPAQMGPQWLQVRSLAGAPIDERIWVEDPPASSYPACIAVKAAERQGAAAGGAYLRRLREAVMLERRNIARAETLRAVANELAADASSPALFDADRFALDLDDPASVLAFRDDLKDARYRDIGRFPALTLQRRGGPGVIIVGYRPYEAFRDVLAHLAPEVEPMRAITDLVAYVSFWGRITAQEAAVALDLEIDAARTALNEAVAAGTLRRCPLAPGTRDALYAPVSS